MVWCLAVPAVQKKEKWVKESQGQLIITAGQMIWTHECEKALSDAEAAKKTLRQLKKKWISYLNKLTAVTRSKLNKIERNKVSERAACTMRACSLGPCIYIRAPGGGCCAAAAA